MHLRSVPLALALAGTLSACAVPSPTPPDDPGPPRIPAAEAEREVRDFLIDLGGRAADFGWSRLHPSTRRVIYGGDRSRYEAEVRVLKIGVTELRFGESWWDGDWHVRLELSEPFEWPDTLAGGRIVQVIFRRAGVAQAVITVRLLGEGTLTIWGG